MHKKDLIKLKLKHYEVEFFKYYSEHYMENIPWLTMQWGYVKFYILSVMGVKHKSATPNDVMMGQIYLNDLKQLHGDFLV